MFLVNDAHIPSIAAQEKTYRFRPCSKDLIFAAVSTDKTTSNKSWQLGRELMEHMKNDVFWHERNYNAIRLLAAMVPSLAGQTLTRGGESLVKHVLDTR